MKNETNINVPDVVLSRIRDNVGDLLSPKDGAEIDWKCLGDRLSTYAREHLGIIAALGGSAALLAIVCGLVKMSGLGASLANRKKRQLNSDHEIDPPPPGTPLLEALGPEGLVEHSGLFLGDSRLFRGGSGVAELHGSGKIRKVSLSNFLNGTEDEENSPRCGWKIFAACDKVSRKPIAVREAVAFAKSLIKERRTIDYNIMLNNCHRFTASCLLGRLQKPMDWEEFLAHGGCYSIARLEEVIAEQFNGGKEIEWFPVRRSLLRFNYAPSEKKRNEQVKRM